MMGEEARRLASEAVDTYESEVLPLGVENVDEGRTCSVCGGEEYGIFDGTATCILREHTAKCRCGGRVTVRAVAVEIGGALPFRQAPIIEASCSHCDDIGKSTAKNTVFETAPVATETFETNTKVFVEKHSLHRHHISYVPEETVLACAVCHSRIHSDEGFRPDLTPDLSRREWEAIVDG